MDENSSNYGNSQTGKNRENLCVQAGLSGTLLVFTIWIWVRAKYQYRITKN